jgi:hypothetical protein
MKIIKSLLFISILVTLFTGCIHQIDKQGLTLSITPSQLSKSFNDSFPIKKDLVFGTISINSPKIDIKENSNRLDAGINLNLSTLFTKTQNGKILISGEPYFNKEETSIYLQNVKIEEFSFAEMKLGNTFSKTFLTSLQPMINEMFKKFPIYRIPEESFQGSFVKNISIEDKKLLITYGL